MTPAQHFTPWQSEHRPCGHCSSYAGLLYGGSAASCKLANGPRLRLMPVSGCASFEREVGADDVPDKVPAAREAAMPHAGPWKAKEAPAAAAPLRWAPYSEPFIHSFVDA